DVGKVGEARFSERLLEELRATFERGEQAILLRNRRGYAPVLLCRACGEDMRCPDCGLPRTYHRKHARLVCAYCGSTAAPPASRRRTAPPPAAGPRSSRSAPAPSESRSAFASSSRRSPSTFSIA